MSDEKESQAIAIQDGSLFLAFDNLDDKAIVAQLEGYVVQAWAYEFLTPGGKVARGLSKVGVDQAILELEKWGYFFEEEKPEVIVDPADPDYVLISVRIKRWRYDKSLNRVDMGAITGHKRQWRYMKHKDGSYEKDPFFYEKGCSKAFRNAKKRIIKGELEAFILAAAQAGGKSRTVADADIEEVRKPKPEERAAEKNTRPGHEFHGNPVADGRVQALHKWMGEAGYPTTKDIQEFIGRYFKEEVPVCLHKWCKNDLNWDKLKGVVAQYMSTEGK